MATLNLFLKTLELVEEFGGFVSFLNTFGAILLLICLCSHQLFLLVGFTPMVAAIWASTITLALHYISCSPQDMA